MAVSTHRDGDEVPMMVDEPKWTGFGPWAVSASLLLAAVVAAGPASAADQPFGRKPTLHTPDVIAPAVLPYLACLYAERGLPLLRAADGTQVSYDKSSGDCSAARARASADAAKLLQGKTVPGGRNAATFIDQTLADMDAYVASLPMAKSANGQSQAGVIGIPVTIEDEVQPAYNRYDDCLKTQVSDSLVTPDTVMAKFREAMATCASVRGYAISEATKALVAKGWDEATRTRAAESTFAKVDESWLAMGKQYEASLRVRAEEMIAARAAADKAPAKRKRD
jgi:hypothetical protein